MWQKRGKKLQHLDKGLDDREEESNPFDEKTQEELNLKDRQIDLSLPEIMAQGKLRKKFLEVLNNGRKKCCCNNFIE